MVPLALLLLVLPALADGAVEAHHQHSESFCERVAESARAHRDYLN